MTDSATGITTTYYYDFTDRIMKYVESGTDYSHSVGYEYDTLNNLTQLVETVNGTDHTTSYTYDDDNRVKSVTTDGITVDYTYDGFGRVTTQTTKNGDTVVLTESFTYKAPSSTTTSAQIATYTTTAPNGYSVTYSYTYDDNGNITSINDGTYTTTYEYDSANQLISEENPGADYACDWTYDNAGNLLTYSSYYEYEGVWEPLDAWTAAYDDEWGDLAVSGICGAVVSDEIGNTLQAAYKTYTWEHGRQLASMTASGKTWDFTYNADGLRTQKSNSTDTYTYVYNGSQLTQMTKGTDTLYFTYDAAGAPLTLNYNGTVYYYATNIQGDVAAILNSTGTAVVTYAYDAWGNPLSRTGSMANTLGVLNPLRYRGYVYDTETGLYYLHSRYYDPEIGRFISADAFVATGQGFVGNNMFAYCLNNPINFVDKCGRNPEALQWWSGSMWWLFYADTALPIGDTIYVIGVVVLGAITLATNQGSTPQITFDEATTYGAPSPNNDDDDDDDDDYYNDDNNFGGRQKIGKSKGNTPGNNQKQNKQFKDATKGLTQDQQRVLHDKISGKGLGYHEIARTAEELFAFLFCLFTLDD